MRVGILGFGTVGQGVLACSKGCVGIEIIRIFDRKGAPDYVSLMTKDSEMILGDQTIEAVVECLGGLHPAYEYVCRALQAGKHVVTSNKALVSTYYAELIRLAAHHQVHFCFTSAVGGGIPWLINLKRAKRSDQIKALQGIVNGTCNYILDQMERRQLDFHTALDEARRLGYAEADPQADLAGFDTRRKCVLSIATAFNYIVSESAISTLGIEKITAADIDFFRLREYHCRLTMQAAYLDGQLTAYVEPTLFDPEALEGHVLNNNNLISLIGEHSGRLSFYGQGAGKWPTGNAVIQDLADLYHQQLDSASDPQQTAVHNELIRHAYYIRLQNPDFIKSRIAEEIKKNGFSYLITKPLSIPEIQALDYQLRAEQPNYFIAGIKGDDLC